MQWYLACATTVDVEQYTPYEHVCGYVVCPLRLYPQTGNVSRPPLLIGSKLNKSIDEIMNISIEVDSSGEELMIPSFLQEDMQNTDNKSQDENNTTTEIDSTPAFHIKPEINPFTHVVESVVVEHIPTMVEHEIDMPVKEQPKTRNPSVMTVRPNILRKQRHRQNGVSYMINNVEILPLSCCHKQKYPDGASCCTDTSHDHNHSNNDDGNNTTSSSVTVPEQSSNVSTLKRKGTTTGGSPNKQTKRKKKKKNWKCRY